MPRAACAITAGAPRRLGTTQSLTTFCRGRDTQTGRRTRQTWFGRVASAIAGSEIRRKRNLSPCVSAWRSFTRSGSQEVRTLLGGGRNRLQPWGRSCEGERVHRGGGSLRGLVCQVPETLA